MAYLDDLAGGLQRAAGVLNPRIQSANMEEDQRNRALQAQQAQMLVRQMARQVESGAIAPEKAAAALSARGINVPPELLGGPSLAAQKAVTDAQREQAFRAELQALGPDATQEQLAGVAAKYGSPGDVLRTQQASIDRQAAREASLTATRERIAAQIEAAQERTRAQIEAARQRGEDQRAIAKIVQDGRTELARLTASLRPAPAVSTTTIADPNDPSKSIVIDTRTRQKIGDAPPKNMSEKAPTEFQGKNALYGARAVQSDRVLKDLEEKISLEGLATKQAIQGTPIVGGVLGAAGNVLLSANQQSVEQAQRNFVNAVLRQESGAVISDAEFENAKKQYFPQSGDTKQVIEQKRKNRQTAIQGFKKIAGPAWFDVEEQTKQTNIPAPPPGFKVNQ